MLVDPHTIQRTLAIRRRISVQLVSCLTGLDSLVSVHTNNNIFTSLVKSNPGSTGDQLYTNPSPPYGEGSLDGVRVHKHLWPQ